jgi:hypothetical protein
MVLWYRFRVTRSIQLFSLIKGKVKIILVATPTTHNFSIFSYFFTES